MFMLQFFFQLLTSFCPNCSHIFKTLNAISKTSVCFDYSINTICVFFSHNMQSITMFLKCLHFIFTQAYPKTKSWIRLVIFTEMKIFKP